MSRRLRAVVVVVHVPVPVPVLVPVVGLSELNRGAEQRAVAKPAISDLRESSSLEQDAGRVVLRHRESAYEKDDPLQGEADFIVAEHRNGPTDDITVAFHGMFSWFVDLPSCRLDVCRRRAQIVSPPNRLSALCSQTD